METPIRACSDMTTASTIAASMRPRPEDVARAVREYQEAMEPIVRAHTRLLAMLPAQYMVTIDDAGKMSEILRRPDPLELTIIEQHQGFARSMAKLYGLDLTNG